MEFLANSLLELITQTSTNLPPDVRAAMSLAAGAETPGTQSSQALDIILLEHRHGASTTKAPSARTPACPPSWSTRPWA